MNKIHILPEKVASQIAAGEVVDRPASVVRELIDNSIDAAADRIFVRIEMGGKGLIKVNDNGVGMSRDDILLCVERYATSKIETASDLFSVKSFGFRGEALPSIASVSRTEIVSRPKDQLAGHRLKIAGGRLISIEETGAPAGTIIEVRNLFYNIPARRKFLRAVRTETDHIIDVFSRVALPFPGIAFRLEDAGKTIMNLPASDQHIQRLYSLMGRKVAEAMIEVQERNHDLGISAYLAPPDLSRTRGDRLFVYVNGRNIRDRLVTKAVLDGYGQRLMKGQYPQAAIFIEIDPSKVDVNIHPTKQEVRFHNSRDVFQSIVSTVGKALGQSFHPYIGTKPQQEGSFFQKEALGISEPVWKYNQTEQSPVVPFKVEEREQSLIREAPRVIGQLGNTYILCQVRERTKVYSFDMAQEKHVKFLGHGIGVSGGAMTGRIVFTLEEIKHWRKAEPETSLIIVRGDTVPDDIREIHEADGLLTARGGSTSHAAIVAHRLGKTCVVGCANLVCMERQRTCSFNQEFLKSGDWVSIDGLEGSVYAGQMKIRKVESS